MNPAALVAGDHLLHYRILERIGAGGMGVVWKARDTKLGREVALKVLPVEPGGDSLRTQRFLREAQLASALNHPNIITIYETGCDRGVHFIAMEYVRGQTLRELVWAGRLPVERALAYAVPICEALAKAHAACIVHRDLKSANIMVSDDGVVKVLDFGLARASRPDPEATAVAAGLPASALTLPGSVMGTPGYMSPEQALGDEVDERSDVYSFGVVLYELATGVLPFPGASPREIAENQLRGNPRPLAELAPEYPPELEQVVRKCLQKEREQRYANCQEVAQDLRRLATSRTASISGGAVRWRPAARTRRRAFLAALSAVAMLAAAALWFHGRVGRVERKQRGVAVLPFTSVNADERAQAFGLGLVLAVSTHVSRLETFQKAFWVVPAADVFQAKALSARDARQSFGVDLVVSGSVETTGRRVRVTASVIDARNQRQIRSRQITTSAGDAFRLQDELVQAVGELLELELPAEERASALASGSSEPGAQDYYLQGRGYLQSGGDKADPAIEVLLEALKRDPQFALAHTGLGEAYLQKYTTTKQPVWIDQARASCQAAIEIGGRTPQALLVLGMIAQAQGRYEESASLLTQATRLEPRQPQAWTTLAQAYESQGRMQEAEEAFQKAVQLQPGYPVGHQSVGSFYYRRGRYTEAAKSFERQRELAPDSFRTYTNLGALHLQMGRYRDAEGALKKSLALQPSALAYNNLSSCYFYQERYTDAVPMMEKAVELGPAGVPVLTNLARVYKLAPALAAKAPPVYQRAADLARTMLKVNTRDADTHADLAVILAETGDKAGAEREILEARRLAPSSGAVLFRAVFVYEQIGERERALESYQALAATGSFLEEVGRRPELKSLRADPRFRRK